MKVYLRLPWFLIPGGLCFSPVLIILSVSWIFWVDCFDMQTTEQNVNGKIKCDVKIKQINSFLIFLADTFLKMQQLHLHPSWLQEGNIFLDELKVVCIQRMFVLTSFYPLSFLVILLLLIHESLCAEEQHYFIVEKSFLCKQISNNFTVVCSYSSKEHP